MEQLDNIIDSVQQAVFQYKTEEIMHQVSSLIHGLSRIAASLKEDALVLFNQILGYISASIENKDYLLLSDLLEYELKPFLNTIAQ